MMMYSEIFEQLDLDLAEKEQRQLLLPIEDQRYTSEHYLKDFREAFLTIAATALVCASVPVLSISMMW